MSNILCVYYSRTGHTEKLMYDIAKELGCELVKLEDGENRAGLMGWLRSGMQAMARKPVAIKPLQTQLPLGVYDLVILGTPVWAGRCSAPMRSFLIQYGEQLRSVAYVITRSGELRCEDVFEQMDMYVKKPRIRSASISPGAVGSEFWRDEFLSGFRGDRKEREGHAG